MIKRMLLAALCALLLVTALPMQTVAAEEVVVIDVAKIETDEDWLRELFPRLRSVKEEETRLIFASAPKCAKTRAVESKGRVAYVVPLCG